MKEFIIILFFITFLTNYSLAFNLDETVDDDIRKNYNSSKLIEDIKFNKHLNTTTGEETLPALPNIPKTVNKPQTTINNTEHAITRSCYVGIGQKVKKGKKFKVRNIGTISDYQTRGTLVKFVSDSNINGKGYTIPVGTIFNGRIVDSHTPQISCNGGLIVIEITSMQYKNEIIPLKGFVVRANDKKIFFNNIKGKRTYLKTLYKKGNWGRTLFGKMLNLTISLGKDGSTILFSPFPFLYGTICLGANTLISPVTAFFSKGGHISIPANSQFILKTSEDIWLK